MAEWIRIDASRIGNLANVAYVTLVTVEDQRQLTLHFTETTQLEITDEEDIKAILVKMGLEPVPPPKGPKVRFF